MILALLLSIMGFIVLALSLILVLTLRNGSQSGSGIITILVLGDIGRSPRMRNHSTSFASRDYQVQHVGYKGESQMREN